MAQFSPEMQQKIREFQEAQQQARIYLSQKYQFDLQLREAQNARTELEKTNETEVYKAVGQILIKSPKAAVLKELNERIETLELRLKSIDKQEKKTLEKVKELQKSLQAGFSGLGETPSAGEGG